SILQILGLWIFSFEITATEYNKENNPKYYKNEYNNDTQLHFPDIPVLSKTIEWDVIIYYHA
ncbi:MAG: hypothetical protein QN834_10885, partial [Nitrososphaeraceae archaeon]|nr:hypothetical protein [Nitrososphaeraceae archaeon]